MLTSIKTTTVVSEEITAQNADSFFKKIFIRYGFYILNSESTEGKYFADVNYLSKRMCPILVKYSCRGKLLTFRCLRSDEGLREIPTTKEFINNLPDTDELHHPYMCSVHRYKEWRNRSLEEYTNNQKISSKLDNLSRALDGFKLSKCEVQLTLDKNYPYIGLYGNIHEYFTKRDCTSAIFKGYLHFDNLGDGEPIFYLSNKEDLRSSEYRQAIDNVYKIFYKCVDVFFDDIY